MKTLRAKCLWVIVSFVGLSSSVYGQRYENFGVYDIASRGLFNRIFAVPDFYINGNDAQLIINALQRGGGSPVYDGSGGRKIYDITSVLVDLGVRTGPADNVVTALDALLIINQTSNGGPQHVYQNVENPFNVNASLGSNGEQTVTALDAVLIINFLGANGPSVPSYELVGEIGNDSLMIPPYAIPLRYRLFDPALGEGTWYDVNGDGVVTGDDTNAVVAYLEQISS